MPDIPLNKEPYVTQNSTHSYLNSIHSCIYTYNLLLFIHMHNERRLNKPRKQHLQFELWSASGKKQDEYNLPFQHCQVRIYWFLMRRSRILCQFFCYITQEVRCQKYVIPQCSNKGNAKYNQDKQFSSSSDGVHKFLGELLPIRKSFNTSIWKYLFLRLLE